ncbi:RNA polymerase sigma factor FliA [Methylobacter sp. S3L5C]|uniref:RNA polymerase sigma factor FliA n=1 Tax=Methylobacter sp. S3L5C TaxID=2839024 RepID=UPI001FADE122|nr:RNA polymerase sigma factor FliA [Methylobacter sp. S3L5C]UOA08769.1 RNA polymerase sigma factor FliA [Methylobacter sp. S3L5C]
MYDAKGRAAKEPILDEHILLVKKLAHQLKAKLPANIDVDDLIQAGMLGLLDAMRRYENTHQAQFETYATLRIRGAMVDELRCMDWTPRSVRQSMRKIETAITEVQHKLGRPPSEEEIANKLNIPLAEYQKMLTNGAGHQLFYFEDFTNEEDGEHFLDHFHKESSPDFLQDLIDLDLQDALAGCIEGLPEREKLLMALYYEQELNLKEIGAVMGVTESRVSQLHSQAIARIRDILREQKWIGEA